MDSSCFEVAALARNEGVQSKRTEILQRLESLSPREVDVLCYVIVNVPVALWPSDEAASQAKKFA
jgi:hypothetical protein